MNFATPTAFLWALLALPIVVFYILKIRLRRVPVSTVMFWRQIFEEKQPRSIWQTLRHLLSLLLQLAFLMLLVGALSDPAFDWQTRDARRLIVIVDNSASMRATDVEPTRLAAAKGKAGELIDGLRLHDEMALIAAGTQPTVVCGLTGHQRTLREALDRLPETDGPAQMNEALRLARRLLAEHETGSVVVLSDGCFEGAASLLDAEAQTSRGDLIWVAVGRETDNVAITQFQVRRSLIDPIGYQIQAEVKNFSSEPVELRFEINLGTEVVDVVPLELEPEGTWSQFFEKASAEGGELLARLDRDDAFLNDNVARAILPKRERHRVVLVTEGNVFLQRVFEADPLVDLEVRQSPPESAPAGTVVVFHRNVPESLPAGNLLVIEPVNSTDLWELADVLQSPVVAEQDKDSRLMTNVRLDSVLMPEARRLNVKPEPMVLAKTAEEAPLYFAVEQPGRKVLVLTVNLDQGDLPLRTAFPIMVNNALGWFAGTKGELREAVAAGLAAEIVLPDSIERAGENSAREPAGWDLKSPDGRSRAIPVRDGRASTGPLDRCGIWRVDRKSPGIGGGPSAAGTIQIACNLSNRSESDLRVPEIPKELRPEQPIATAGFGGRPVWYYLIALAFLLIGMEWWLYQRRWIS